MRKIEYSVLFIKRNIRIIRRQKKITIKELAKISGYPAITIYSIEHGIIKHPREQTIKDIAQALGTTYQGLMKRSWNLVTATQIATNKRLKKWKDMTINEREAALKKRTF